jgi:hypothetical protein
MLMKWANASSGGAARDRRGRTLELPVSASHKGTATGATGQLTDMPTLFRFLVTIGIIAGIAYGAMYTLVAFVEPKKGEMTVRVPLDKLD